MGMFDFLFGGEDAQLKRHAKRMVNLNAQAEDREDCIMWVRGLQLRAGIWREKAASNGYRVAGTVSGPIGPDTVPPPIGPDTVPSRLPRGRDGVGSDRGRRVGRRVVVVVARVAGVAADAAARFAAIRRARAADAHAHADPEAPKGGGGGDAGRRGRGGGRGRCGRCVC